MGRRRVRLIPILLIAVVLAAVGYGATRFLGSDAQVDATAAGGTDELIAAAGANPLGAAPLSSTAPRPQTPSLVAELNGGVFRLSGVVPDAATAVNLIASALLTYGDTVAHSIEISPEVGNAAWLAGAADGLALLPMITEGSIRAEGDQLILSGQAPDTRSASAFEQAVTAAYGLSNVTADVEVTNLAPPRFNARMKDGVLVLSGEIPDDLTRDFIVGGAVAVYGVEAVVDETIVADGLYTAYWMYTMPDIFELLEPFADYEFTVENGITSGSLNDGANFASGSSELDDSTKGIFTVAIAMLKRDPSLGMVIEGHTDNVGSRAFNQRLSEERADSAIGYLIGSGIDADRLTGIGYGEDRPADDNATSGGRATNRRVVFIFEQLDVWDV